MREIVLDTETTGLDPKAGHRIIEIGCVELENHMPTGRGLQLYINPERDIPEDSIKIHGITEEFVKDKPPFRKVCQEFLDFIQEDKLVIHNAEFDIRFLNAELAREGKPPIPMERSIDTVKIARKRFPGAQVNLDALCRRFDIDLSARVVHGALLDCELLAAVYLELSGGRQPGLELKKTSQLSSNAGETIKASRRHREPRPHVAAEEELAAHNSFLEGLKNPIWQA
ncbi:DNA polymerase III subunit epsilon [Rhodovibrionaceae bacterium A322]